MSAGLVGLLVGVALTALWLWMALRDHDQRIRVSAMIGGAAGIVLGALVAFAAGRGVIAALATGLIGGAVLALMLLLQWRLIRALLKGKGMT